MIQTIIFVFFSNSLLEVHVDSYFALHDLVTILLKQFEYKVLLDLVFRCSKSEEKTTTNKQNKNTLI